MKANKLKPSKVTLSVVMRGKMQFQHGSSMERLQENYLESYKKAFKKHLACLYIHYILYICQYSLVEYCLLILSNNSLLS
jgi:hypothetical protein